MLRQVGEESVLLNLKTEQYLGLDDVSSRAWRALTEGASIQAAYEALLAEYDVEPEQLRRDLEDFVQELIQLSLVQQNQQ
jgi:hypothetical protein